MTAREQVKNLLMRKDVDRASFAEALWSETIKKWTAEGHLKEGEDAGWHFSMEIEQAGWLNTAANLDVPETVLEETEETKLVRNGNGAHLRVWKNKSGTPEHVYFEVTDRKGWEQNIAPYLKPDRRRVDFENYRKIKRQAAGHNNFFACCGTSVFEQMHSICGHENLLAGMALDAGWISDMSEKLSNLVIDMWDWLFQEEGLPDGIFLYEDLGFKGKPFMSPAMYRELILPAHKKTMDWAHSKGLRVIMHSCGMVELLVPGMIEAGIDMLQAMEVKAGMDVVRLNRHYGNKIGFMGNIDIREIISNDRRRINLELEKKIIPLMETRTPYILSSDHSTPPDVEYETFLYFRDRGLELARYR